ncbi:MAG: hypothetical protein HYV35_09315 [Lentisphaerae bacterium]|nr:hypothetical protein [Lentisphaerota bacterium]
MKRLYTASRAGRQAERVFQHAVAKVVERSRRLGLPIAIMRNGRAVLVRERTKRKKKG